MTIPVKSYVPLGCFAAACLAGAELGRVILVPAGNASLPVLWPPAGLLVGALLLTNTSRWIALSSIAVATMVLSAALHDERLVLSAGLAALTAAAALVTAWLARRSIDGPVSTSRIAHMWAVMVSGAVVPMVAGTLAAVVLYTTSGTAVLTAWRSWWLAETLSILFIAPLVCAVVAERHALAALRSWRSLELVLALAGAIAITEAVFGDALPPLVRVPAYVMPFLLWPAFRSGPAGSAIAVFGVCLVALWHTAHGHGPFALSDPSRESWILRSQGTMAMVGISFTMLATVVAERRDAALERARLIGELKQALAEIKTLRGLIPICAWCHKVRDDAGFWQQLETFLGAHTGATFSHEIGRAV